MSVDISKLKQGDVVVFGGKVEKTVQYGQSANSIYFAEDAYSTDADDRIWQIAELKKPELPKYVVGIPGTDYSLLLLDRNKEFYSDGDDQFFFTPHQLLLSLKFAVAQLEEAGIE